MLSPCCEHKREQSPAACRSHRSWYPVPRRSMTRLWPVGLLLLGVFGESFFPSLSLYQATTLYQQADPHPGRQAPQRRRTRRKQLLCRLSSAARCLLEARMAMTPLTLLSTTSEEDPIRSFNRPSPPTTLRHRPNKTPCLESSSR